MSLGSTGTFAGMCVTLAGCTSLLGDFTPGSGAGNDGAGRDATVDGTGPRDSSAERESDAGTDALTDASVRPLSCNTWRYASPIVLETLSAGTRRVQDKLRIFVLPRGQVRVIAGKNSGIPFTVYTVDTSQTSPQVTLLNPAPAASEAFVVAHRSPSSVAPYTVALSYSKPLSSPGTYYAYSLPDTMPATGPVPSEFTVYQETILAPSIDGILSLPLSATDLFTAIAYPTATMPVNHVLGVGRATTTVALTPTTLSTVATSPNVDDVARPNLFHANGNVYIYDENDTSSPGVSSWAVPDTATVTTPPMKRAVSAAQPAFIHAIGENVGNTTTPSANILYQESTVAGTFTNSISFRAGTIPYSALGTWVSTDLPLVRVFTDVYAAPTGVGNASIWVNDNIMLIGPGLRNGTTGVVMPGLNLLWVDSTGAIRSEQTGANNLLSNLDDFTGASASPISIGTTSAKWAVTWVETKADDAGMYDVVQYNELDCQPATRGDGGGDGAP
jgi:hypothetical protein